MVIFQDYKPYKFLGIISFLLIVSCSEVNQSPVSSASESTTTWKLYDKLQNQTIVSICGGQGFTLFLDKSGNIYSFGRNDHCQLGIGFTYHIVDGRYEPLLISQFFGYGHHSGKAVIKMVCSGKYHSLARDVNGNIYSWGYNDHGQCGLGDFYKEINAPRLIKKLKEDVIVDIKAECNISYAKSDNNLHWLWGENYYGQCELKRNERGWDLYKPLMINALFYAKTGCMIKEVHLSVNNVFIVGEKDVNKTYLE